MNSPIHSKRQIFDLHRNFFEDFGRAVIAALPQDLRRLAEDQLNDPEGEAPTLLIILAHAGRAHRAISRAAPGEPVAHHIDEAVARAAISVQRALSQPAPLRLVHAFGYPVWTSRP